MPRIGVLGVNIGSLRGPQGSQGMPGSPGDDGQDSLIPGPPGPVGPPGSVGSQGSPGSPLFPEPPEDVIEPMPIPGLQGAQGPQGSAGSGGEIDYVEFTAPVSPTHTTEATADVIVTGSSLSYNGSTKIRVEFGCVYARPATTAGQTMDIFLFDNGVSIGRLTSIGPTGGVQPLLLARRLTPSNGMHQFSIRAEVSSGTGLVQAGVGGLGNVMPGWIRITAV